MAQESERDRVVHIKASSTCKLDGHGTGVRSPRAGQRRPAMPTWINELQALAVPMIALAAAGIALQQSRSARQKLRLDCLRGGSASTTWFSREWLTHSTSTK